MVRSTNNQISLTDSATINWNFTNGNIGQVTIAGNRTLNISNVPSFSFGVLKVTQDSTGSRTIAVPGFTPTGWALSSGPGQTDILGFYFDGTSFFWTKDNYGVALPTLATPGSFAANTVSPTELELTWNAVTNATGYILQRATNVSFTAGLVDLVNNLNVTVYNDTSVEEGEIYFYRVKARADGFNDSAYSVLNSSARQYLTWTAIGSDMEAYNTSRGIRKKASGTSGWAAPSLAGCSALSNQTMGVLDSLTVKVGADPTKAVAIILSAGTTPNEGDNTGIAFGFYSGVGLAASATCQENNAGAGSSFTIAAGHLLRMTNNGTKIVFEHSSNAGVSWTTRFTSVGTPASSYNIIVQAYSPSGGFDEIYK